MQKIKIPHLAAVMTPFPYHIDGQASIDEAYAMMQQHQIRHLPVMVNGNLETVLSERDVQRVMSPGGKLNAAGLEVSDLCPARAYIADVADPLDVILDAMNNAHIGSVIVTRDGELAGIFTERDASCFLLTLLREATPDNGDDLVA